MEQRPSGLPSERLGDSPPSERTLALPAATGVPDDAQLTGTFHASPDTAERAAATARGGRPAQANDAELPQIDGYVLLAVLGRGGMGVVYKARQKGLNRLVALKMILAGAHAGADDIARFCAEAEAVARLQHPHIVQIYEVGKAGGHPFFSLEFVDGGSLASVLLGAPQPSGEAANLIKALAEAMHYAHENGVVHRDLKPANILLVRAGGVSGELSLGTPKIADFGLAKQEGDASGRTVSGSILGTPSYMAPEQASGRLRDVGPAADVYSLGIILYEMLIGRPPFRGATVVETLDQVRSREPVPPRQLQPSVPADLETICLKCLQKDIGKRYASALDLAEDLRRFLAHEPILARPVSAVERTVRWVRRNPTVAGLAAGVVLMAVVGVAGVVRQWRKAVANEQVANQLADAADQRTKAERWERYRANLAVVASALAQHNVGAARQALESAPEEHRGWEWRHFASQLDGPLTVWEVATGDFQYCPVFAVHPTRWQLALHTPDGSAAWWDPAVGKPFRSAYRHAQAAAGVAYSADGKRVAIAADDNEIHVWNTETGQRICRLPGHKQAVLKLAFDRDGSRLASGGLDREVRVWDVKTGTSLYVRQNSGVCNGLAMTPDGTRLVIGSGGKELVCLLIDRNEVVATYEGQTGLMSDIAMSPDGKQLACASTDPDNKIRLWDLATGTPLAVMSGHANHITRVAFSPDGKRLASASLDQTVRLWDAKSGNSLRVLNGHTAHVYGLAFSPDGTRLLSGSTDETARLWDGKSGDLLAVLRGHRAQVAQVAFSHDGSKMVSAAFDGTIRLWDARLAETAILRGHKRFAYDVAFAPNGKQIASVGWDGALRLWDLATGQQVRQMNHPADVVVSVDFDARGQRLVTLSRFGDNDELGRAVTVWDMATGTVLRSIPLPKSNWKDARAVFSPRGDSIAVGDNAFSVRIFDAATGAELAVLEGHKSEVSDVAFRPDGALLASSDAGGAVRIWDALKHAEIAVLHGHKSWVHRVTYSRDGKLLASASYDKTVRLWDANTHQLIAELPHGSVVYGVSFSPDGTRLATGCADKTIRLWDLARHQQVAELRGHEEYVHAVAFSPDGTRLVSASGDASVRVWDTLSAKERER